MCEKGGWGISQNGTLDPRRVQWHFIEQLWPFNCALITFMSRGRQQPQNNPSSFMNSPLGHCQSRPSPGTLAAPRDPLLPLTPVLDGVGWLQHCHGAFCWGICLLSHVGHVDWKQGALTQLGVFGEEWMLGRRAELTSRWSTAKACQPPSTQHGWLRGQPTFFMTIGLRRIQAGCSVWSKPSISWNASLHPLSVLI